jgi:hypothetical protein
MAGCADAALDGPVHTLMRHHNDTTNDAVRQVTLPSGRTIEIVYLDETPAPAEVQVQPGDAAHAEAAVDLTVCGACACTFVQPVDWEEAGPRHWRLELRCPNCESRGTVVVEDEVVDHYDLVLERGSAELARSLHEVVESSIEDEVTRLRTALERDLILPEDF